MKTIEVVAAVIVHDGKVFAAQRGYGDQKDGWEFPGGKMEAGETPKAALVREIREELAVTVTPIRHLTTVEYDYPKFHLTMHCFLSSLTEGEPQLLEHEAAKWLTKDELDTVAWLPADVAAVEALKPLPSTCESHSFGQEPRFSQSSNFCSIALIHAVGVVPRLSSIFETAWRL